MHKGPASVLLSIFLFAGPARATDHALHVHEPLSFDLVRSLGARKGELEVNTLLSCTGTGAGCEPTWAPEIELTLFDGVGLELELPHQGDRLESVKTAFQLTLPGKSASFRHGLQVIEEHLLHSPLEQVSALYLLGLGSGRFSSLSMWGASLRTEPNGPELRSLVNVSFFYEWTESLTLGFETNCKLGERGFESVRFLPQVQKDLTDHVTVQLGVGLLLRPEEAAPFGSVRVVLQL
ncbi:MAG: hypothetical protein B6A08_00080 [Sorangiineae bacterium NIC37A_2]|jgi:hypothetical protein|nr:MAG: hypothetical protein B6A08_00080 [Sorangiineae bacterium NIC37A_2]